MNTIRNFVTLVGNMGSDAKITELDNGQRVARFQLSTQKSLRKNDGRYTAAVEYGEKGKKVAIHGRLVQRTYLTKNGVQRVLKEVEVRQIIGL